MAGTPPEIARLRELDLFRDVDEDALTRLAGAMVRVELAPGELLMREGEKADSVYVVLRGRLAVSLSGAEQGGQVVSEIGPGGVAGEIALLTGGRRSATVAAVEPTALMRVPSEVLDDWLASSPEALGSLRADMRRRLDVIQLAQHLGRLIGTVHPDVLRQFEPEIEWLHLKSGQTLFDQGEIGDSAFIVISGRLRVILAGNDAGTDEEVVNELGRGEMVGEMALLDGGPRSTTIYAVRDTHLAKLSERAFMLLTEKHPVAMKRIASSVVSRLRAQLAGRTTHDSAITSIALVPVSADLAIGDFSQHLADALASHGPTQYLSSARVDRVLERNGIAQATPEEGAGVRLGQWLDEQEAGHRYLLYEADPQDSGWTERAIGRADEVLLLADSDAEREPGALEQRLAQRWADGRAPRRRLIILHRDVNREPTGTAEWLAMRHVDAHYHLCPSLRADYERLARVLTGRGVGLVLGGGGARGFAHLGVWRALEELGVPIDFVGGTSIGSIAAGAFAMGISASQATALAEKHFSSILDPTLPLVSLLAGRRIRSEIAAFFGERRIEDLRLPYFCLATNLSTAGETVHRSGSLADAIRSSISIPGVLPPFASGGHLLVDGGLLNNVPIDVMQRIGGGGPVLAVDVTPTIDLGEFRELPPELSGWGLLRDRLNPLRASPAVPYILSVLARSTVVASAARRRDLALRDRDLYLRLPVEDWSLFDFSTVAPIAQRGYETSLGRIRDWWARIRG